MIVAALGTASAQENDDRRKCVEAVDPDLAVGQCTRALQSRELSRPNLATAFSHRGDAYQTQGAYDLAIRDYDQTISLNPDHVLAFNNRGTAYQYKGEYDRAIQDYDRAIDLQPDYGLAYYNRGLARFDGGMFAAAIPDFARAAQLEPANPYRVIGLYLAQARAGEADRGNLLSRSSQIDFAQWPGPVIALFLGELAPEAVSEVARDREPRRQRERQCEAYFYLGEYFLLQGQRSQAIGLFRAALQTGSPALFEYVSAQAELRRLY